MMQSSSAVPPPVAKSDIAYAGFWRRLLAYLIDGTLLAGLDLALYSTVHVLAPDNLDAVANVVPVARVVCERLKFAAGISSTANVDKRKRVTMRGEVSGAGVIGIGDIRRESEDGRRLWRSSIFCFW